MAKRNAQKLSVTDVRSMIESEGLSWQAGTTELSGLSAAEQKRHLGLKVTQAEIKKMAAETATIAAEEQAAFSAGTIAAPTVFDWRNVAGKNYVTPVKNQGACGSCVSFCTCATIESAVRIKAQDPNLNIDLSEAFCQFCGGGSCSGWGLTSGLAFAKSTGITDEACFPYQPQNMPCNNRCADWQSRLQKISSYAAHSSMQARKDAIATKGPLLAGMAVYNDFFSYSSGVYQKTAGSSLAGYHCICVVGYDDNRRCWILKNSWGTNWGQGGFCRLGYGQSDLLIDTSWSFYSVEPTGVQPTKGSGSAKYILVDKHFAGGATLWAYAGAKWRNRGVTDTDLSGFVQELFTADRVDVWWDGSKITLIRPWKTP